ncbi:MAG: UDP-N-acetylmuramate dehydrogenase [Bacteroidales bacterium]|jgi:UDP-N-acetylmuramate dehydrogenase|nr:UDP-N-acetylmuramate dehydrogenase [Bacteroidales bacterium]
MIEHEIDLKPYNTFSLHTTAKTLIHALEEKDIEALPPTREFLVLGSGSNVIFTEERIEIPVVRIENKGIKLIDNAADYVLVEVAAGEQWSDFVLYCCENWWCGVENLAAVYGTVGAAPVQNIGAYGVEIKDFVHSVLTYDVLNGQYKTYYNADLNFGYRYSRFKYENKYEIIWKVRFRLSKQFIPNLSYNAVACEVQKLNEKPSSPIEMCNIITEIRNSKLPNPTLLPNVGSFFKNPVVSLDYFHILQQKYPDIPSYNTDNARQKKISAAWLIEKTGWKGRKLGEVSMFHTQALVMVAYKQVKGSDIMALANAIKTDVKALFGINLEIEAHII